MRTSWLARYVHARRPGWRLVWKFLPNVLGPFVTATSTTDGYGVANPGCEWNGEHEWEPCDYEDGSDGWYCLNCGCAGEVVAGK